MKVITTGVMLFVTVAAAQAACPQELAVYEAAETGSGFEFVANSSAMAMSHEVRILVSDDLVMTGFVGATVEPVQTYLLVPHECPEGDVTGEELAACIVYEDVIYAIGDAGQVSNLPLRGEDAAKTILLPGFIQAMGARADRFGAETVASTSEIFQLSGCQD